MASLLKKTETPSVGQVREEPVLAPELESVANGEASIGVEQPHFSKYQNLDINSCSSAIFNESTEVHNPRRDCAILTLAHETHQTSTV